MKSHQWPTMQSHALISEGRQRSHTPTSTRSHRRQPKESHALPIEGSQGSHAPNSKTSQVPHLEHSFETASPATENQPPCWRQALPVADATAAQRNPFRTSTKRVRFQDHVEETPEPSPPLCGTVNSVSHPTEDQVSFQIEESETPDYPEPWVKEFLDQELAKFDTLSGVSHIAEHRIFMRTDRPLKQRQPPSARLPQGTTSHALHRFRPHRGPPDDGRTRPSADSRPGATGHRMDVRCGRRAPTGAPRRRPSQPLPSDSLADPFRPRALPIEGTTIDDDNVEEANTGNHAGPRRPSTEGMPPLASQHTSPIGPSLLPLEVAHHRGDEEEGVNPDEHARLRPSSARGMPPLVSRHIGPIGSQQPPLEVAHHRGDDEEEVHPGDTIPRPAPSRGMPLQAPLRTGHIGPQAPLRKLPLLTAMMRRRCHLTTASDPCGSTSRRPNDARLHPETTHPPPTPSTAPERTMGRQPDQFVRRIIAGHRRGSPQPSPLGACPGGGDHAERHVAGRPAPPDPRPTRDSSTTDDSSSGGGCESTLPRPNKSERQGDRHSPALPKMGWSVTKSQNRCK
ncbi:arginine-glutamic acid dipeptide repeats protein-like [Drosophila kikkawai]|uniref:Arginine-glutamic acid dipeptide repeats protein-like n=1 Tax=Drosophila kikkawai TaxID=30033 RepID=A0ABM4GDL5_DROKI